MFGKNTQALGIWPITRPHKVHPKIGDALLKSSCFSECRSTLTLSLSPPPPPPQRPCFWGLQKAIRGENARHEGTRKWGEREGRPCCGTPVDESCVKKERNEVKEPGGYNSLR